MYSYEEGQTKMKNIYKLSVTLTLGVLISAFGIFTIGQLTTDTASAQDEGYYQEDQDNFESPQYDELNDDAVFDENEDQNPDPEFMEEVEPGEYDQSDDVTELDDNNY